MVAHASIGMAVLSCQGLEMLFALCVKLAFKHKDATSLKEITPLEKNFTKPSMRDLLKELGRYVEVTEEFKSQVEALVEKRHTLIHRWGPLNGLPQSDSAYEKIGSFANELSRDANALSNQLRRYVVQWLMGFPEFRKGIEGFEQAWLVERPEITIAKT
jgi:hypothetical protein